MVSVLFHNFIEFIISLYTFLLFLLLDTKNILFVRFYVVGFQMYYLLVPVQELLVIFPLGKITFRGRPEDVPERRPVDVSIWSSM